LPTSHRTLCGSQASGETTSNFSQEITEPVLEYDSSK